MIGVWVSRCLPGFSILGLLALLLLCSFNIDSLPRKHQPPPPGKVPDNPSPTLSFAQHIFIAYTILVHLNALGFTLRLCWSLVYVFKETSQVLKRRPALAWRAEDDHDGVLSSTESSMTPLKNKHSQVTPDNFGEAEVIHAIIIPNYKEDIDTLQTTLNVLASHPRARTQYEIYIAMEQKEPGAAEKATKLVAAYEKSFLFVHATFHPAGLPSEIAGKGSNVAFAARHIGQVHRADLNLGSCNVIITVMDADTHLWQDYFTELRRHHYSNITEAHRTVYSCPIIFDRNSHTSPILVRCADLMWSFAGLSTMHPGASLSIPTSVYSLSLILAEKVGGWDSDPTSIGEDMHMMLKCYFETARCLVCRVVYVPASQCNVSSDIPQPGWRRLLDTCHARYLQALRHMWGALDSGFAARHTLRLLRFNSRCLFLWPRHLALLHLLWEAHFLPCHLVILMAFSTSYENLTPASNLHPDLAWAFWLTGWMRALSFIGMNISLALYERWYAICLRTRMNDMLDAKVADTGFSRRCWWHLPNLCERIVFPVSGMLYGAVPAVQAVFSHFWTDRLEYRVSKKPTFVNGANLV